MKKTRWIPAIVMLTAGFLSCVMSIYRGKDFLTFAKTLLLVMLIFYVLGGIVAYILQRSFDAAAAKAKAEAEKQEQEQAEEASDVEITEGKSDKPES